MPDISEVTPLEIHLRRGKPGGGILGQGPVITGKGITAPAPSSPPPAPVVQATPPPAAPVGQSLTAPSAAPMPVHPNAATADPNKMLFNASKGIDGTGIMQPATTVTNGNLAAGLANKDSKGVIANGTGGNNLGDAASIIQGIMAGGSTTDATNGITGPGQSPLLEMRGSLDPAAAQAVHNRVDFSAGSVNDPAANAKYADEVQKAMRVNAASGIAPTSDQIKTTGMSNADVVNLLSGNNSNGQFSKGIEAIQTQQGMDAAMAKSKADSDMARASIGIRQQGIDIQNKSLDVRKENADSQIAYRKTLDEAKKNMGNGGMSKLDPQARKDLAKQYAETGKMPPLGMGAAAAADREAILGEWSSMMHSSGGTVEDQVLKQSALKASQGELNTLQKQRGTVMAFAKTADSNLDLVSKLSDTVSRSGAPMLNKWILAGKRSVAGDPEVAKFDAAVRTAINEYAKVTSSATGGSVTSDSARKEVESMLNTAQTPEQVKAVIGLLRQEIGNRQKGYDDQIGQIKSAITGGPVGQPLDAPPAQQQADAAPAGNRNAELVKKDLARGAKPSAVIGALLGQKLSEDEVIAALRGAGVSDHDIAASHDEYMRGVK